MELTLQLFEAFICQKDNVCVCVCVCVCTCVCVCVCVCVCIYIYIKFRSRVHIFDYFELKKNYTTSIQGKNVSICLTHIKSIKNSNKQNLRYIFQFQFTSLEKLRAILTAPHDNLYAWQFPTFTVVTKIRTLKGVKITKLLLPDYGHENTRPIYHWCSPLPVWF